MPSLEWLSTTITLNANGVFWESALARPRRSVRARLRTGITTLALTGKSPPRRGHGRERRREVRADPPQVRGRHGLHLDLVVALPGIDVGEVRCAGRRLSGCSTS